MAAHLNFFPIHFLKVSSVEWILPVCGIVILPNGEAGAWPPVLGTPGLLGILIFGIWTLGIFIKIFL
jgi:hypothetical protein